MTTDINSYQPDTDKMVVSLSTGRKPSNPIRDLKVLSRLHFRNAYRAITVLSLATVTAVILTLTAHAEASQAEMVAKRLDKEFAACLRGEWTHTTEQGDQLGCHPVEVLHKDNIRNDKEI